MPFLKDTFTDTDGDPVGHLTLVSRHIGECAADYQPHPSFTTTPTSQFAIASNRVYSANAPRCIVPEDQRAANRNHDLWVRYHVVTAAGESLRACVRVDFDAPEGSEPGTGELPITGSDTMLTVHYDFADGFWKLQARTAGGVNTLDTWAEALVAGNSRLVRIKCRDGTIEVYIDGVLRMDSSDAIVASKTGEHVGLMCQVAQTSATGMHVDEWWAVNEWEADAILHDRFEGTEGGNLNARGASHSGHTWAKHPAVAGDILLTGQRGEVGSGLFYVSQAYMSVSPALYVANAVAPADHKGELVLRARGTNRNNANVALRVDAAANTCYLIGHWAPTSTTSELRIVKRTAGADVTLDSHVVVLADRFAYLLEWEIIDSGASIEIIAKWDGVEVMRVTDNSPHPDTGIVGIAGSGTASTTTGRIHFEDIWVRAADEVDPDVLVWEGDFSTGDLSQFTQGEQSGIRQYVTHEEEIGGSMSLLGVQSRYGSAIVSTREEDRPPHEARGLRCEVRNGDTGGSNARNRVMLRINEAAHGGWDERPVYHGLSFKLPKRYNPALGAGSQGVDVNTIFATHNRSHSGQSPNIPGIEPCSLLIDETQTPPRFGMRFRGGWQMTPYGPGSSSYRSARDWDLGPVVLDEWIYLVFFQQQSPDIGVGRFQLWMGTEDTFDVVIPKVAVATTHESMSNYAEYGYYRELDISLPMGVRLGPWRTGYSFDVVDPTPP